MRQLPTWPLLRVVQLPAAAWTHTFGQGFGSLPRLPLTSTPRSFLHFTGTERQQVLSQRLDAATLRSLTSSAAAEAERAHLCLVQQPGAGAWLNAPPCDVLGLAIDATAFRVLLRLRLRLPIASSDGYCTMCDGLADRFGDHARACTCDGDRVKRHNRLRNLLALRCDAAGLSPELEKPGLLPPRPTDAGGCEAGQGVQQGRRPADVFLPMWGLKGPAALDLAVTSGMRPGCLPASASDGGRAVRDYESRKRAYQHTEAQCKDQGIQFLPLVFEACGGGFGPTALGTIRAVSALAAVRTGEPASVVAEKLQQALSVCLQREAARAVLRRLPVSGLRSEAAVAVGEP